MTDSNREPDASADEIPKGLRLIREMRARAKQLPPEQKASPEAAAMFVGPIGTDDDGRPLPGLTEAQKQHKDDVLTGRKPPGSPVEDPQD